MKNILLAVCGLSPQVITEALYALLHEGRKPDAVHVITTRAGRDRLLADLFAPHSRILAELLADFRLNPEDIEFSPRGIHTLRDRAGVEIDDIVTAEDNELLLRLCLDLTFHFSADSDSALWFLVAGGRKTMTSCLTLAAQLYGRRQDRILHVLVSPEFESCRDFWFPPRASRQVELRDERGQPFHKETRFAEIRLITIPFVPLRPLLASELLDRPREPAELMASIVRDSPKRLFINLPEARVSYGPMQMDMHPARLALYAFFAERKKKCRLERICRGCEECFVEVGEVLDSPLVRNLYQHIPGGRLLAEMSDSGIGSLSRENFNSYKSKIRRDLLTAFGPAHISELEIASTGSRPDTRYGLRLDRNLLRLEW